MKATRDYIRAIIGADLKILVIPSFQMAYFEYVLINKISIEHLCGRMERMGKLRPARYRTANWSS